MFAKKKHAFCDSFIENPSQHIVDDSKHTNQVMYNLGDANCASVLNDEEFSILLTDDQVANTFSPIGETAEKWEKNKEFRDKIIDRALELRDQKEAK